MSVSTAKTCSRRRKTNPCSCVKSTQSVFSFAPFSSSTFFKEYEVCCGCWALILQYSIQFNWIELIFQYDPRTYYLLTYYYVCDGVAFLPVLTPQQLQLLISIKVWWKALHFSELCWLCLTVTSVWRLHKRYWEKRSLP